MPTSRLLSSLLLSASLLFGAACSSTTTTARTSSDAGVTPITVATRKPSIDRAKLRAALGKRREQSLARFLAYRDAGVYPVNSYRPGIEHVWIDASGNLCAAATVISQDWGRDATARVGAEDNFIRLADVHEGPLADWILTSGLTHGEIVAIQEPMVYEPDLQEQQRLFAIYNSVERQIRTLWDESLDDATDKLMAHPELAALVLDGQFAGAGKFATPAA